MWWGMAIAIVLAGAGFALLFGFIFTSDAATGGQGGPPPITNDLDLARQVFTGGIGVGYLLTLAIGVMTIGSEYRHKTVTSTFLAIPKRVQVMGAKVVSLLVIGAMYAVLSLVGSVVTGGLLLTAKGHAPFADPEIWRTLALALLVLGLWALIGLGVGILIPNQVAALLIAIGVAWIIEPILGAVLGITSWGGDITPYLPSQATSAMLSTSTRRVQREHGADPQLVGRRPRPGRLRRGHGRHRLVADGARATSADRPSSRPNSDVCRFPGPSARNRVNLRSVARARTGDAAPRPGRGGARLEP